MQQKSDQFSQELSFEFNGLQKVLYKERYAGLSKAYVDGTPVIARLAPYRLRFGREVLTERLPRCCNHVFNSPEFARTVSELSLFKTPVQQQFPKPY
jgi:hypothetical protein